MKIYIVRHVQTEGNVEHRFNGVSESDYTEYGLYMKDLLVPHLAEIDEYEHFDAIFTSPIKRAANIAEELGNHLNLKPIIEEVLKEYNFGIFDGHTPNEMKKEYPQIYNSWINDHLYEKIPTGDSYIEKFVEVRRWMKQVLQMDYQSVIIFTHGATARCILTYLLDISLEDGWHIDIPLGGYCKVDFSNNYGTLQALTTPSYENNESADFIKSFKN